MLAGRNIYTAVLNLVCMAVGRAEYSMRKLSMGCFKAFPPLKSLFFKKRLAFSEYVITYHPPVVANIAPGLGRPVWPL